MQRWRTARSTSTPPLTLPLENAFSAEKGLEHLSLRQLVLGAAQQNAVDDDPVGAFAWLQRTGLVVEPQDFRAVDGIKATRLFAGQRLLGMELAFIPAGAAGHGGRDAEKRVVGVVGSHRA